MELTNLLWEGVAENVPSHVTVIDWVEKCGMSLTAGSLRKKTAKEAYSLIIDNSITKDHRVGSTDHLFPFQ